MIRFSMLTTHLQTMPYGFEAYFVAILAFNNTFPHLLGDFRMRLCMHINTPYSWLSTVKVNPSLPRAGSIIDQQEYSLLQSLAIWGYSLKIIWEIPYLQLINLLGYPTVNRFGHTFIAAEEEVDWHSWPV
jgi:hypothetical protein